MGSMRNKNNKFFFEKIKYKIKNHKTSVRCIDEERIVTVICRIKSVNLIIPNKNEKKKKNINLIIPAK